MILGFHYHIPALFKENKIHTTSYQGLFIDSLAVHFDQIVLLLHSPNKMELDKMDYQINSNNVNLISIGPHRSIPARMLVFPFYKMKIKRYLNNIDAFLIRSPTPYMPLLSKISKNQIPIAYLIVGELSQSLNILQQHWIKKRLISYYIRWSERKQMFYAKDFQVFANNTVLFEKFKPIANKTHLVRTTTISKSDFFLRKDTCQSSLIKILYSGRIERAKGVLDIMEAITILRKRSYNVIFDIVGWPQPNDDTLEIITKRTENSNLGHYIKYHGRKKVGIELFKYYRNSDLFVTAAQSSFEGIPRTIVEAMSQSVPVISTPVGSIPFFHRNKHDIILCKIKDPVSIADEIENLINNPELRQKLIRNARESIRHVTLEEQANHIAKILKELIV